MLYWWGTIREEKFKIATKIHSWLFKVNKNKKFGKQLHEWIYVGKVDDKNDMWKFYWNVKNHFYFTFSMPIL